MSVTMSINILLYPVLDVLVFHIDLITHIFSYISCSQNNLDYIYGFLSNKYTHTPSVYTYICFYYLFFIIYYHITPTFLYTRIRQTFIFYAFVFFRDEALLRCLFLRDRFFFGAIAVRLCGGRPCILRANALKHHFIN